MSEDNAWNKFSSSGSIMDYLVYASIKNSEEEKTKGVKSYGDQHGRFDNNGEIGVR